MTQNFLSAKSASILQVTMILISNNQMRIFPRLRWVAGLYFSVAGTVMTSGNDGGNGISPAPNEKVPKNIINIKLNTK
jgi:drug/metabolite transporter (DMT)-like permease